MSEGRRHFSAEQKAGILREHLIERVAVADLCEKHGLRPTVFYRWQREMFENLAGLLERRAGSDRSALARENAALRAKLARKDEVIAEIMADFIAVKKPVGGD
jgi:transposase-like protein